MTDLRVALWVLNLAYPVASLVDWLELVETQVRAAAAKGAQLLVLPEYACAHWLFYRPGGMVVNQHLGWMAAQREVAVAGLAAIAARHDVDILAGTHAVPVPPPYPPVMMHQPNDRRTRTNMLRHYNRAILVGADGHIQTQDKVCITPWELGEDIWNLHPAESWAVMTCRGVRCAVMVCLDVEQPVLAIELMKQQADCLIVPSMTSHPSGYHRVFACARARAIEALLPVAVVGAVGVPPCLVGVETNYAGAAAYVPAEMGFNPTGILMETEAAYEAPADAPYGILAYADLPIEACRHMRATETEAWPGLLLPVKA